KRIERDIDLGSRAVADYLTFVERFGFVFLALADNYFAVHRDRVEGLAHCLAGRPVGHPLVAFADEPRGGERGSLGRPYHLKCEISLHPLLRFNFDGRAGGARTARRSASTRHPP